MSDLVDAIIAFSQRSKMRIGIKENFDTLIDDPRFKSFCLSRWMEQVQGYGAIEACFGGVTKPGNVSQTFYTLKEES